MQLKPSASLKDVTPDEKALAEELGTFVNNPLGFVKFAFHWKEAELSAMSGPDKWQTEFLSKLGEKLDEGMTSQEAVRMAIASGHGVGKTATVAWVILWFMSTRPNCQCVVTANTQSQLSTKTWRELAKWHRMCINRHHFKWTATSFFHVLFPETWRANAIPWSEANSEAFAGTHAVEGVLMVFDEASAIADMIWEVVEGAMTTVGAVWLCFGNPTKSNGRFYDCFNGFAHRWTTYKVDSRNAKVSNRVEIDKWVEDYGEDSDFVRVRVRGEFPKQSINQFISSDVVLEAIRRQKPTKEQYNHHRTILGVDVARFGTDQSVIVKRQGPVIDKDIQKFLGLDTMSLSGKVLDVYRSCGFNAIVCVDGVGVGAGVVDRLRSLGVPVVDVQSGAKSFDIRTYFNKRSELYGRLKDWLYAGGCLPNDIDISNQLRTLEYQINNRLQIQLMSKEDIRKEIGSSPDTTDAIAYTFAAEEQFDISRSSRARIVLPASFY